MDIPPLGLPVNKITSRLVRSVHNDRLMSILHGRGVQLRLADGYKLNLPLRTGNRQRPKQRSHPPIGSPRQSFDQFVVAENGILTGRLNALQTVKCEWATERNGGPRCPGGQSYISRTICIVAVEPISRLDPSA